MRDLNMRRCLIQWKTRPKMQKVMLRSKSMCTSRRTSSRKSKSERSQVRDVNLRWRLVQRSTWRKMQKVMLRSKSRCASRRTSRLESKEGWQCETWSAWSFDWAVTSLVVERSGSSRQIPHNHLSGAVLLSTPFQGQTILAPLFC